jgi:hypothetical protein
MPRKDKGDSAVENAKQPSWKKFFSKKGGKTASDANAGTKKSSSSSNFKKKSGKVNQSNGVGNSNSSVDETRKNSSDVEDAVTIDDPQIDTVLSKANTESDVVSVLL